MSGDAREFMADITGCHAGDYVREGRDGRMSVAAWLNEVTMPDGEAFSVALADGLEDARSLVGRRVRVTVEVDG